MVVVFLLLKIHINYCKIYIDMIYCFLCLEVSITPKKRLLLIVNPRAGKMKVKKAYTEIISLYKEHGFLVSVAATKSRGHATKIVKKKGKKYDVVVCCGGDGTLNEVLSGLAVLHNPPKLGYIPCGSTNDFAAGLKLPKNMLDAARKVIHGKLYSIDLGKFKDKYFAYIASFGAFTEVSYATPQDAKNMWGHLAYIFEGIKDIPNIRPQHAKIIADGKEYEDDYIFCSVSNAMSIGGILKIDPKIIKLDDGLFEVMLIKAPSNGAEMQRIIGCLLSRHFDDSMITFIHAANVEVYSDNNISWSLDGEYADGGKTAVISNLNKAIKIYR